MYRQMIESFTAWMICYVEIVHFMCTTTCAGSGTSRIGSCSPPQLVQMKFTIWMCMASLVSSSEVHVHAMEHDGYL